MTAAKKAIIMVLIYLLGAGVSYNYFMYRFKRDGIVIGSVFPNGAFRATLWPIAVPIAIAADSTEFIFKK